MDLKKNGAPEEAQKTETPKAEDQKPVQKLDITSTGNSNLLAKFNK